MAKNKLSKVMSTAAAVPTLYKPSPTEARERRRYQAEDALRTITRAAELQRDRPLMREVQKVAREQMQTLRTVTRKKS